MTTPGAGPADAPAHWEVVRSTPRFTGAIFGVRTDTVRMPADGPAERDVVEHAGSVGVIALDPDHRVLLVRQYRHPVGRLLWEPPAGLLDVDGEDPLDAARRELFEEGHLRAADWRVLVDAFTTPGMSGEATRLYLARELTTVPKDERHAGRDEEADMATTWAPLPGLVSGVLAGRLHDSLLVMGVLALDAAVRDPGLDSLRPATTDWPDRPAFRTRT